MNGIISQGTPLHKAKRIVLLIHGRGSNGEDMMELSGSLDESNTHFIAPNAENGTWYPYSFLQALDRNEPYLSKSLSIIKTIIDDLLLAGIKYDQIYIIGFSQGACLTLEFVARNAQKYGGIAAFTGGLLGDVINVNNYSGDFLQSKIYIANSDNDPHVPLAPSKESKIILEKMGADVSLFVYQNMPHTIIREEIDWVNNNLLSD